MNIVKNTLNKVQELEKRLDNTLAQEGLRVSEVKQDFENEELSDTPKRYKVLSLVGGDSAESIVLQGEVKFRVYQSTNITLSVVLDGYVVYSETRTVNKGIYSWGVLKAIHVAGNIGQDMELIVELSGGGSASLIRYDIFFWGYGTSVSIGELAVEPRVFASCRQDRYNIYLSIGEMTYKYAGWGFPESLTIDDFEYFGNVLGVVPVHYDNLVNPVLDDGGSLPKPEEITPPVYNFIIDNNHNLFMTTGESDSFSRDNLVAIATNVSSVTATCALGGEVVVVYSSGNEIFSFGIFGGVQSEVLKVREFNESVSEVSLVQDCTLTTFLVVGLESGKNYLLSSITNVRDSDKHSKIRSCTTLEFV